MGITNLAAPGVQTVNGLAGLFITSKNGSLVLESPYLYLASGMLSGSRSFTVGSSYLHGLPFTLSVTGKYVVSFKGALVLSASLPATGGQW